MFEDYVVVAVGDGAERNHQERIRLKAIRDMSNPFNLAERKFKKLFRIPRTAAQHLIESLQDVNLIQGTIPKHIKVLAALNFYSHGSYQAGVGENSLMGLSQPSTSRCINITTNAIVRELAQTSIKFPSTAEQKQRAKRGFLDLYGMPGVLGAVDGTHISIFPPPNNHPTAPGSLFYCRKGYHSINVQMVVNANGKVSSINANFPGSTHDSAIWSMSHLKETLEKEHIEGARNQWLLGDKGYALQPWLLTPFRSPRNAAEENYNTHHKQARNVVEMCFGRLKNKLRCLHKHRALHYEPPTASKIIIACCVLYNKFTDVLSDSDDDDDDTEDEDDNDNEVENAGQNNDDFLSAATRIRDDVVREYFS